MKSLSSQFFSQKKNYEIFFQFSIVICFNLSKYYIFMFVLLFCIFSFSTKKQQNFNAKESESDNNQTFYPTSILIDESNDQIWSPYKIDRSGWIATADSEQTTSPGAEGPVSNILDGNSNTLWHSKYNNNGAGGHEREKTYGPYQITINLGSSTTFKAFSYMPRKTGQPNGRFRTYDFYVAQTLEELTRKINNCDYTAKGFIDHTSDKSTLVILPFTETARYIALRSLNHDTFGTCAEFNLYSDPKGPTPTPMAFFIDEERDKFWNSKRIDRSGWSITANSEQTTNAGNEGPIANILDGNTNTLWHSRYNNNGAGGHDDRATNTDPFEFKINLGQMTTFRAFSYMPRKTGDPNGRFRHYEFYMAQTQDELNTKMQNNEYSAKGDIDHTLALSTFVFFYKAEKAQFIALRSLNHDSYGTCAEFNLFSDSSDIPKFTTNVSVNEQTDQLYLPYRMSRSGWSITANSEQTTSTNNEGPVTNILDGNANTHWHSKYNDNEAGGHDERTASTDPFKFTINLNQATTFRAFSYMPRSSQNGRFKHYEFYAAQTQEELDTLITATKYTAKGDIVKSSDLSTIVILDKPITAQYIALLSLNHDTFGTCAEFNLYSDIPIPSITPNPTPTPLPVPISKNILINEATDQFWPQYKITRTGWTVRANSEQTTQVTSNNEGVVTFVVDGNAATIWHSRYDGSGNKGHDERSNDTAPFELTFDLGQETTFKAFSYMPRSGPNGRFRKYELYSGNTSEELFTRIHNHHYISKDNIDYNSDLSTLIIFKEPQVARYVAILSIDYVTWGTCAEINLYSVPSDCDVLFNTKATGDFDSVSYLNSNRIPTSKFTATTLGDQNGHPISYAFDSSTTTFWASSTENTDTVKNTIEFAFTSLQSIEAIVMHPAFSTQNDANPKTRRYDGFPTTFKVYSASSDGTYKLHSMFIGTPASTDIWDRVQFAFSEPLTSKKIKLEFTEVTRDVSFGNGFTPACAELYLVALPPKIVEIAPGDTEETNGRIDIKEDYQQKVVVQVNIANFTSINTEDDGGAIKIVNAGLQCDQTSFDGCSSAKSGGAIYLNNQVDIENSIVIQNINFNNNEAKCGGAIYIYSSSKLNGVLISYCIFVGNTASATPSPDGKFGGSAIFLTARNGSVKNNIFRDNKGDGPALKIYNRYEKQSSSASLLNHNYDNGHFVISNCQFEINKNAKGCLFYDRGRDGAMFEIVDCKFSGSLAHGSFFIDGNSAKNDNSPKLAIRRCKFSSALKNALNLDPNNNFMSVDLDDQVFLSYSEEGKKKLASWKIIVPVALAAVAVAVIVVAVIVMKRKKPNKQQEHEMTTVTHDFLMDESLL